MRVYVSLVWWGPGSISVIGVSRTLTMAKMTCNVEPDKWTGSEPRWIGPHKIDADMSYTIFMTKLEG